MLDIFRKWYERYLFEEESILLLVLIGLCIVAFMTIGDILAPLLASLVLAYLMQGLSTKLQSHGLPQWFGFAISFLVFVGAFFAVTLILLPLAWRQLLSLAGELPRMLEKGGSCWVFYRSVTPIYSAMVSWESTWAWPNPNWQAWGRRW